MDRLRVATTWLAGCSGCHMSFLDLDEWLVDLAGMVELVYSPIMDVKAYPENVDVCLIEGAVANEDNLEQIHLIRRRTRILVSFGDCAVTGNVTAMRNWLGTPDPCLQRAYLDPVNLRPRIPAEPGLVPQLLPRVMPIHEVVPVEYYLPGCPPTVDRIKLSLQEIVAGRALSLIGKTLTFG